MSGDQSHGYITHPLWDAERDEPYLPLPDFPDMRMTPFREGDDEAFVSHLTRDVPVPRRYAKSRGTELTRQIEISNDEQVRKFSLRRPYPSVSPPNLHAGLRSVSQLFQLE